MFEYSFEALGTKWTIISDGREITLEVQSKIGTAIASFEKRFSRFKTESEVNRFRQTSQGLYPISEDLRVLLIRAQTVKDLTGGRYDPASGVVLEHLGYDQDYRFTRHQGQAPTISEWNLDGTELFLSGPIAFDFGGIGKGFAIDMVANLLRKEGFEFFLVDGGGDMYATSKADDSAYRVALEWPGRPDVAFGTVELRHQGLAVSDTTTRRFGPHHHIVDARKGENTQSVRGVVAISKTAWDADSATAALIQWPNIDVGEIEEEFGAETVVITEKEEFLVSPKWQGEIFS
jgi:thiamine biosynthesis lipoprotein